MNREQGNTGILSVSWPELSARKVAAGRIWRGAVVGALISIIVSALILFITTATFKHDLIVPNGPDPTVTMPLTVGPIVVIIALAALGASLLLWLLGRFARRPFLIFWIMAGVLFLLSLVPVFTTPGPAETHVALLLMHLVTALSLTGALTLLASEAD